MALVLCSFGITATWFGHKMPKVWEPGFAWEHLWNDAAGWLEPLAMIFTSLGAFTLAIVFILRRMESTRAEADSYGLARGLATGYYFNFIKPLLHCMATPAHGLHDEVRKRKAQSIGGLIVGFPQSRREFDPAAHKALLQALTHGSRFILHENIRVDVADRPRPLFVHLVVSTTTGVAILMDLPTTLAVIPDFADFIAQQEAVRSGGGDDRLAAARGEFVSLSEATTFKQHLEVFVESFVKTGSLDLRRRTPISQVHVVPISSVEARMRELVQA